MRRQTNCWCAPTRQTPAAPRSGRTAAYSAAARRVAERHLTCDEAWPGRPPWESDKEGIPVIWTAIWTLLAFELLLFHGDAILAFAADQLAARRAHRLDLQRERTKQALHARQRHELVRRQLDGPTRTKTRPPTMP
jgi:hypothetical protein